MRPILALPVLYLSYFVVASSKFVYISKEVGPLQEPLCGFCAKIGPDGFCHSNPKTSVTVHATSAIPEETSQETTNEKTISHETSNETTTTRYRDLDIPGCAHMEQRYYGTVLQKNKGLSQVRPCAKECHHTPSCRYWSIYFPEKKGPNQGATVGECIHFDDDPRPTLVENKGWFAGRTGCK